MRKLCTDEVRGSKRRKMKKQNEKKTHFAIERNVIFSLLLFIACSFSFAFQR
jgi:hypothetical protein